MSLNPNQEFGDGDASKIDEAIAKSVISNYVGAKNLKTIKGAFEMALPEEFEAWYKKWGESTEDVDEIPGFVNRDDNKKPLKLRLPGSGKPPATFEVAVHETIHLNAALDEKVKQGKFQRSFGVNYNEGVTEYFTEKVLGAPGRAYRAQLELAKGLIAAVGESDVADAYFKDQALNLHFRIEKAFVAAHCANSIPEWSNKSKNNIPHEWNDANKLLQSAMARAGSGSGAGSGSAAGSASDGSGSTP